MTDKIVVLSTCATADDAEMLARVLVTEQLAACVSIVPRVQSFYRWKGKLETADEFLLIIKTSRDLFDALNTELEKLHPFEVPEVLAIPIVAGAENYLNWLGVNLRGGAAE
jgi:periplasmic divalent cation tolerance protein